MKISSKSRYGLRALVDLAQHYGNIRRSRDIAYDQTIDEDYLNQLLITLRKAGFILSVRGPQGGHRLAIPPDQINLYQIFSELEGEIAYTPEANFIDNIIAQIYQHIHEQTTNILQTITLQDICERCKTPDEDMYYI